MVTPAKVYQVDSPLDPGLITALCRSAERIEELDSELGNEKWNIAGRVNGDWSEHKNLTYLPVKGEPPVRIFPTHAEYYAECSRVANTVNRRRVFGESGQTLRRWCEMRAAYGDEPNAAELLDKLSFDHLFKANKLYTDSLVKNAMTALKLALQNGWSADEMDFHYRNNAKELNKSFVARALGFFDKLIKQLNWGAAKRKEFFSEIQPIMERYLQ